MEKLQDFIANLYSVQEKERFEVDTLEKASWVVDKIAQKETLIQKYTRLKTEYLSRINQWYEDNTKGLLADIDNLQEMIRPYAYREVLKIDKKSLKLPQGTIQFRKSEAVQIEDEQALIRWLKENNYESAVNIKESASKTEVKKIIESGIQVPGAVIDIKENYSIITTPIEAFLP